ncbi:hypothetical protein GCM10007358_03190 [Phocicoccus schoeneichii]|uniref:Cell-wall binding lipoprotein n=1 Tax=Phocicoccus schoeneichii TaxID=1812261 RepID=A0A6V7RIH5_9BACL|nr:hypothetical protein [Jeotgalicoccus schoeneichii]GGH48022.1 hypothetical protein GCM10007358_03190 [Jeotgalicoccus schoeneichii]CAD2077148.1 hypothetical protein JEOSCH030_01232 [Jeotgalicoccus schoeneichii]
MKRFLLILSTTLLLGACSSLSKEDSHAEKQEQVSELQKELQSAEVENKQLKADIEHIDEEIARIERDSKDENITIYKETVDHYSKSLSREIDTLKDQTTYYKKTDIINLENIKNIEENIKDIVDDYNKEVDKLKLSNTLTRQDKKIAVFNDALIKNMANVTKAYEEKDKEKILKAIEAFQETVKFL